MPEPIIKLSNVNVIYNEGEGAREVKALYDIDIEIYPGEYVIFFGPSGCGKSTLMNVVAGLERVATGEVIVAGKDLRSFSDEQMAIYHRHQVGFVFQAYNLISTLSVLENIALPQFFDGVSKANWSKNAYTLAERFGIEQHVKKLPQELSGGQQQRVGVARSLINNPAILLADEPTGNLDSKSARNVLDIFQGLNIEEGKTLLFVTHAPDYLGEEERIFYLKDGKIVDEVRNKQRTNTKTAETVLKDEGQAKAEHVFPWKRFLKDAFVPPSVKSEKLTEFILDVPREDTLARIESLVEKRLQGVLSTDELTVLLDKSYYRGGAGLDKRLATRIGVAVDHVMNTSSAITDFGNLTDDQKEISLNELVSHVSVIVNIKLTHEQRSLFKEILKERLLNKIGPAQVKLKADNPIKKGGMGLNRKTAIKVMQYVELMILIAVRSQESSLQTHEENSL